MATCTKGQLPNIKILNVVSGTFGLLRGNGTLGLLLELLTSHQLATAERLWFLNSHVLRTYWAGFAILKTRTGRNDHTLSRWQESHTGGEICSQRTQQVFGSDRTEVGTCQRLLCSRPSQQSHQPFLVGSMLAPSLQAWAFPPTWLVFGYLFTI